MPYKHKETGDDVERERWCWEVLYQDGTTLKQFDDADGSFHRFDEIDQGQLHVFKMVNGDRVVSLLFEPSSMKLVHFYKRFTLDVGGPNEQSFTWYVFGYEQHGLKKLHVITQDDEVVITDDVGKLALGD